MRALFQFEVRRLLRSPLLWGAAVLSLGLRLLAVWQWLPDFTTDPTSMSGSMLLLAAAALLAANLAASRDTRGGLPETLGALPGRAAVRTWAAVAAAVVVGTGIAALVMAVYLPVRWVMGPVAGTLDPYEALAGVLAVPFAAALGALLARWVRWLVAVPVTVFLLGAFTYLNGNQSGYGDWFLPVVLFHAPDWPDRPSGLHVIYLAAATVLLAALALLRHGVSPVRVIGAVTAAAVAVPAGAVASAQAPGPEMNELRFHPVNTEQARRQPLPAQIRERYLTTDAQQCREHGLITYCAFPDYVSWIPRWASAIEPVAEALPPSKRAGLPVVRQGTGSWFLYEPYSESSVRAGMVWGRAGGEDDLRANLASDLIRKVTHVGLRRGGWCDGHGQARTVVTLWLIGQVVPPTLPEEKEVQIGTSIVTRGPFPLKIRYGPAELGYARRLLTTPDTRERIWAHWETLVSPRTTIEQALPLLGLRDLSPAEKVPAEPVKGQSCL
ncbi:ABC transporter [Sphaerimonospora thailandensis]|uniref:ABC transporter n=2 Tax=Sphaerimonospora thailandensis TaxID=795644 RepID=A0A8J3W0H0_9ACTN|nr:ABC transporter [Sphaerimonospora thailandensis]